MCNFPLSDKHIFLKIYFMMYFLREKYERGNKLWCYMNNPFILLSIDNYIPLFLNLNLLILYLFCYIKISHFLIFFICWHIFLIKHLRYRTYGISILVFLFIYFWKVSYCLWQAFNSKQHQCYLDILSFVIPFKYNLSRSIQGYLKDRHFETGLFSERQILKPDN